MHPLPDPGPLPRNPLGSWSVLPALVLLVALALMSLGAGAAGVPAAADPPSAGAQVGSASLNGATIIEDQMVYMNHVLGPVTYSLSGSGIDSSAAITPTGSSYPSLISTASIACGGSGLTRTVTITPTDYMTGTSTITLTASYPPTGTSDIVFDVTVEEVPDIEMPMVASNFYYGADLRTALVIGALYGLKDRYAGNMIVIAVANYGTEPIEDEFWVDLYIEPDFAPTGPNQRWQDLCYYGAQWGITADYLPLDPGEYVLLSTSAITVTGAVDTNVPEYFIPQIIAPTASRIPSLFGPTLDLYVQVDSVDMRTDHGAVLEYHEDLGLPTNNITHGFFPESWGYLDSMSTSLTVVSAGTFVDEPPRE